MNTIRIAVGCLLAVLCGCSSSSETEPDSIGVTTTSVTDASRQRTLPVEVWYPSKSNTQGSAVLDFEQDEARRDALDTLLASAPEGCVARATNATRDSSPVVGTYPLIVYTHCYTCTRWSAHAVIERLVSEGFVVVSADHEGDTLWDRIDDMASPLNDALVDSREADVRFLLDRILAGDVLPNGVSVDSTSIGILGHSIGSVTAGRVAQNDDRFAAVLGMAAPMESVFEGVSIEDITVPLGLIEATEDNSIGETGNLFIQDNFENANTPAYKLDIVDAGHWSVTNIAEIAPEYKPGCGNDLRQTNGEEFTYVPVEEANDYTASFVAAFFAGQLLSDPDALELLESNPWPNAAPIQIRD